MLEENDDAVKHQVWSSGTIQEPTLDIQECRSQIREPKFRNQGSQFRDRAGTFQEQHADCCRIQAIMILGLGQPLHNQ